MKSQIEEQPYPLQTKVSIKDQEKDYFPQEACPDSTLSPVSTERPGSLLSSAVGTVPREQGKRVARMFTQLLELTTTISQLQWEATVSDNSNHSN